MKKFDYLVLGSGIGGLSFAAKMAGSRPEASIAVITKTVLLETNTRYAQGGIAVVTDFDTDSYKAHIHDTLVAGDYENEKAIVEMVVKEAPERLKELIALGASFDNENGNFNSGLEGGHSAHRIIHHKDITGYHIEKALIARCRQLKNITFFEKCFVKDLITEDGVCKGIEYINTKKLKSEFIQSAATIIATGGCGQMYSVTTNPSISTGDGVAMAYRAGAAIKDMQYVQFHPTALYDPGTEPAYLISEAVRGFGAILRNSDGVDFMKKYDTRGSLATRDVVSRAVTNEMNSTGKKHVWLDCRHLDLVSFKKQFPNIYNKCIEKGIDVATDMIPVIPAAHYLCGGIKTDSNALTNIQNLYAVGECACTGLHGANRLASNSLLEAVVFAHRAFLHSRNIPYEKPDKTPEGINIINNNKVDKLVRRYRQKLRTDMTKKAGIVKTNSGLEEMAIEIKILTNVCDQFFNENLITFELIEFNNLIQCCALTVEACMKQKENKGAYYNSDSEFSPVAEIY